MDISVDFITRFLVNIVYLLILLRVVYCAYSKNRDSLFGFFLFGHAVYLVTGLMHEVNVSMGFAFGLFAVLSMLRYRTDSISIRDMSYLFLVSVSSLMAAVGPIGLAELVAIDATLLLIVWFSENSVFAKRTIRKTITYDNTRNILPENRELLVRDLRARIGEKVVDIEVRSVDLVRDSAVLRITVDIQSNNTASFDKGKDHEESNSNEFNAFTDTSATSVSSINSAKRVSDGSS